jgi:hypothetical protein
VGGRASRRKGHDFERQIARELRERTGLDWKRGFQTRGGGAEEADVECDGIDLHIECKKGKSPPLKAALLQAESDAGSNDMAVAVVGFDREEPIVLLRWSDFKDLLASHLKWGKWQKVLGDPTRTTPWDELDGPRTSSPNP